MKLKATPNKPKMWSNGKIVDAPKQIDSLNFTLHYASPAVWEGIRSYKQKDKSTRIYELWEHMLRLHESAKIIGMVIPYSVAELYAGATTLVEAMGGGDLYLRPIAYLAQDAESVRSDKTRTINVDIYAFKIPDLHDKSKGIKVAISSYQRGYPQFQMQAKTPANYALLQQAKDEMDRLKVDDILFTDNQGYVVEATVANLFVIKGGVIMTPPSNGSILPGITRGTVANIMRDVDYKKDYDYKILGLVEKNITRADLYTADEVFICGTYAEVVPVIEVDGRVIGDGSPGFITRKTKDLYIRKVRGDG